MCFLHFSGSSKAQSPPPCSLPLLGLYHFCGLCTSFPRGPRSGGQTDPPGWQHPEAGREGRVPHSLAAVRPKVRGSSCMRRAGLPLCLERCSEKQTQLCLFQKLHILIICSLGVMPPS